MKEKQKCSLSDLIVITLLIILQTPGPILHLTVCHTLLELLFKSFICEGRMLCSRKSKSALMRRLGTGRHVAEYIYMYIAQCTWQGTRMSWQMPCQEARLSLQSGLSIRWSSKTSFKGSTNPTTTCSLHQ